jgi:hypothetical protein
MRFLSGVFLGLLGCAPTVYRDTWRPATQKETYPMLLDAALSVDPEDRPLLESAHAVLIGHHATSKGYATRAASVGGTHFYTVTAEATSSSNCKVEGNQMNCSGVSGGRATKIAVVRIEPKHWDKLPPHLVPPAINVEPNALFAASQARYGCEVNVTWGSVKCGNGWKLYSPANTPTYQECVEDHGGWFEYVKACEHLKLSSR